MKDEDEAPLLARAELRRYAEGLLGERNWFLLSNYGRIMQGEYSGRYVSGIPVQQARTLVDVLVAGSTVEVHLMHRHKSGIYESSRLRFVDGAFVMLFESREELA